MKVRFRSPELDRLETEPNDGGRPAGVAKAYRKRLQMIRAAADERDFYALKSLHYEKLKGDRQHQRSMRLNDQWRLVVEVRVESGEREPSVVIVAIEDYH